MGYKALTFYVSYVSGYWSVGDWVMNFVKILGPYKARFFFTG